MNESAKAIGLCASCRHVKRTESGRGSVFYMCTLWKVDSRFPKYPRLPVLRCEGYEEDAAAPMA